MKREVVEIISGDSIYVLDKKFVDAVKGRVGFMWKKVEVSNEMLVAFCIEQDAVYERRDLIWN